MSQRLVNTTLALLLFVPVLANGQDLTPLPKPKEPDLWGLELDGPGGPKGKASIVDRPKVDDPTIKQRQAIADLLDSPSALLWDNPYLVPRLARARFEADQARVPDLVRAWRAAAEKGTEARRQLFLLDRVDAHTLRQHMVEDHLQSNREAWDGRDATANLEVAWRLQLQIELIYQAMVDRGIPFASVHDGLQNAHQERMRLQQLRALHLRAGTVVGTVDDFLDADDPLQNAATIARYNFEAEQTSTAELARARVAIAEATWRDRCQELLGGRITTDVLLDASAHLQAVKHAALGEKGSLSALESSWLHAVEAERILEAKLNAGTARIVDLLEVQNRRLAVESDILRIRSRYPGEHCPIPPELFAEDEPDYYVMDMRWARPSSLPFSSESWLFSARGTNLAHLRFEAEQKDPTDLARQRYQFAKSYADVTMHCFVADNLAYEHLQEARDRLHLARRDCHGDTNPAATLEKRWRETWLAETMANVLLLRTKEEYDFQQMFRQQGAFLPPDEDDFVELDDSSLPLETMINGQLVPIPQPKQRRTEPKPKPVDPIGEPGRRLDTSLLTQRRIELERELGRLKEPPKN